MSLFGESAAKSKAMKKAIKSLQRRPIDHDEVTRVFEELFNALLGMSHSGIPEILTSYGATPKLLKDIAVRLNLFYYPVIDRGEFLPVALLSFQNPLLIILENKELMLTGDMTEVVNKARQAL